MLVKGFCVFASEVLVYPVYQFIGGQRPGGLDAGSLAGNQSGSMGLSQGLFTGRRHTPLTLQRVPIAFYDASFSVH